MVFKNRGLIGDEEHSISKFDYSFLPYLNALKIQNCHQGKNFCLFSLEKGSTDDNQAYHGMFLEIFLIPETP